MHPFYQSTSPLRKVYNVARDRKLCIIFGEDAIWLGVCLLCTVA